MAIGTGTPHSNIVQSFWATIVNAGIVAQPPMLARRLARIPPLALHQSQPQPPISHTTTTGVPWICSESCLRGRFGAGRNGGRIPGRGSCSSFRGIAVASSNNDAKSLFETLGREGTPSSQQSAKLWGSRSRINKLHDKLVELSQEEATPVPLTELYQLGLDPTPATRLRNAQFLHSELAIRLAQRAVDLAKLPYGLSQKRSIERVSTWYAAAACDLIEYPYPKTAEGEEGFTELLEKMLHDHSVVVRSVAAGIYELKEEISEDSWEDIQHSIDQMLTSFYTSRIGLRFLMDHHIKCRHKIPGASGIISAVCKPEELAEKAASEAIELCRRHTGLAPRVHIVNKTPGATFTYVPSHIHYMLAELLKNSVRAVSEVHGDEESGEEGMPAVSVVVAKGDEDVTFRVSDEGGGIPRSRLSNIFSFLCSTAGGTYLDDRPAFGAGGRQSLSAQARTMVQSATPALAGWGVGLPLSRTYARYFGGELELMSMEGYGTDVYLHLSALGDGCENLPAKVLASPAARASSAIAQAGTYDPIHRHDAYRRRDY